MLGCFGSVLLAAASCDAESGYEDDEGEELLGKALNALGDGNIQPESGTPGEWVMEGQLFLQPVFNSKLDNPVLDGRITLRSSQESQTGVGSSATIRYRLTLSPFPYNELEPATLANVSSGLAHHYFHGIRLGLDEPKAVTLMRDDWDSAASSEGTSVFRLRLGAPSTTVSHELGHSLGIAGDYSGQPTRLMNVNGNGSVLTSAECTTARGNLP